MWGKANNTIRAIARTATRRSLTAFEWATVKKHKRFNIFSSAIPILFSFGLKLNLLMNDWRYFRLIVRSDHLLSSNL